MLMALLKCEIIMKILLVLVLSSVFVKKAFSSDDNASLTISPLVENVYLHTSYKGVEGYGLVGSNGLVVVDKDKAYIVDTPWLKDDTKELVKWITDKGYSIEGSISTHSHEDRTSGIGFLNSLSIATYTSQLTDQILKEKGADLAKHTFSGTEYSLAAGHIKVFYPGAGHTIDNLVVWLRRFSS